MVIAAEEVADFAAVANGVLINVGTVTEPDARAMLTAARAARDAGTPWVLDPVAVGALRFRSDVATQLLEFSPAVIRGNASEILALAGLAGGGKGVGLDGRLRRGCRTPPGRWPARLARWWPSAGKSTTSSPATR